MNGSIRTARKFPSDTPAVGLEQAFRNAKEHDERLRNEQSGRAQAAERLVENTRRQLSDLVGREEWKQLRRDLREIRSDAQRQLQPPAGLDAELGKVRLAQKRKARALLRRLAPNSEAVERLLTAHQQSMMELLEPRSEDRSRTSS